MFRVATWETTAYTWGMQRQTFVSRGPCWQVLVISVISFGLAACDTERSDYCETPSTCQGDTMTNPRLEGGLQVTAGGHSMLIVWEPGTGAAARLPQEYYEAYEVTFAPFGRASVSGVQFTSSHSTPRQILIEAAGLLDIAAAGASTAVTVQLSFPDREAFGVCTECGPPRSYEVGFLLTFDAQGNFLSYDVGQGF